MRVERMKRIPLLIGGDEPGKCAGCMFYAAIDGASIYSLGSPVTGFCRLFKASVYDGNASYECTETTRASASGNAVPEGAPCGGRPHEHGLPAPSQVHLESDSSDLKGAVTYGSQDNSTEETK